MRISDWSSDVCSSDLRILDLGCGDGALTARLAATGAQVVGVDPSEAFIAAARARGMDARVMAGEALTFNREFDAVFRSEERRVGKEGVSTCRSGWSPYH